MMEDGNVTARPKPFRLETMRGEPYVVGERKLTPLARVVTWGKARATIGTDRVTGWGSGFARITPLAFLEETDKGEVRIPVTDSTAIALRGMLLAAAGLALFFTAIRLLAGRRGGMEAE